MGHLGITEINGPRLPIIFVHGLGGSKEVWSRQLAHLRSRHRIRALDLRGHGQSELPANGDFSIPGLSDDIKAAADQFGLPRFVLIGHSLGCHAAIEYAGRYPNRAAGLLLADSAGDYHQLPQKQKQANIDDLRDPSRRMKYFEELLANARESTRDHVLKQLIATPQLTFDKLPEEIFQYDPTVPLHRYPGPKLALHNSSHNSPYSLHKIIPSLPHRGLDKVSHWIMLDDPEAFNRLMDDFLAGII